MATVSELLWNTNMMAAVTTVTTVHLTPDNSNLQGKSKTVGVIGSSKQIIRNIKELGRRSNASMMHTSQHSAKTLYFNWTDEKVKTKNTELF